jgi:hypothetical protein
MRLLHIKLPPKDLASTGFYTLILVYGFLWLWSVGCIFVCLVYGMQFDLGPAAVTITSTSTAAGSVSSTSTQVVRPTAAPRALPVSLQWLYSVFSSLATDILISGPVAILLGVFVATLRARYNLPDELERRKIMATTSQVKWEDIAFSEERVDEFASWIHHELSWAPNFGQDADHLNSSTLSQSSSEPETTLGTVHKFGKKVGVALIQSLAFGMIGGGAVMPMDLSSAPSLGKEISFVAKSAISIRDTRRQAARNSSRVEFNDDLFNVQNQAMYPVRKNDTSSDLVIKVSTFHWLLRLQNVRPSESAATELRIMQALRSAWLAAAASVRLSFVFDADWRRVVLERDLFSRLFLGDLAFACGVARSRLAIVDIRRWYGTSQLLYDQTVVTVDIVPDQLDRDRASDALQHIDYAIMQLQDITGTGTVKSTGLPNLRGRKASVFEFRSSPGIGLGSVVPGLGTVVPAPEVYKPAPAPQLSSFLPVNVSSEPPNAGPLGALMQRHAGAPRLLRQSVIGPLSELAPLVTEPEPFEPMPALITNVVPDEDQNRLRVRELVDSLKPISRGPSAAPQSLTGVELVHKVCFACISLN